MKKIVIMASGNGSNAEEIIKASLDAPFKVSAVICDVPGAGVMAKAQKLGIKTIIIEKTKDQKSHEDKILKTLHDLNFDLVVLAGFRRLLSSNFIASFPVNSIINIHPSILPAYPGLNSYERAFKDGVKSSGVTIHYVDEGVDTGEIIEQHHFERKDNDTLETFTARGLELEHKNFCKVIQTVLFQKRLQRVEIYPVKLALIQNPEIVVGRAFWIETKGPCAQLLKLTSEVLIDPVVEKAFLHQDNTLTDHLSSLNLKGLASVEVAFLPGVTDNTATSAGMALIKHPILRGSEVSVHSGNIYFQKNKTVSDLSKEAYLKLANPWLHQVLVQDSKQFNKPQRFKTNPKFEVKLSSQEIKTYDLEVSDDALMGLSKENLWALNIEELHFIRQFYRSSKRSPTDVEMEVIAQTWSEHCKHKIFAADIEHTDHEGTRKIKSIFKTFIKGATTKIVNDRKIDWTRSVFTDNAGIVRWDKKLDVCIKVETHNSPSALDPYGGSLTGILGVNRDILGCGTGALPIANTDVFCLPPEGADADGLWPSELHGPRRLLEGVHKGVQDGGNKSGIPTVNGAFHYHLSYAGKPLVYCGTVGVLPHSINGIESHEKNQKPQDLVVMVGGRIGKDGIHGATFSSEELKEGTPSTVVQIGDPLTQKRMTDFIIRARDLGLYSSITDNGAGGLSSSVGEMCQLTGGARIDLALAPVKYAGLAPFELMISESQERMTCAVPKDKWAAFSKLAHDFKVEATALGEFTNDGNLTVYYNEKKVGELPLNFLHEDLPPMQLKSQWDPNHRRSNWKDEPQKLKAASLKEKALKLLASPNIRSHEKWVRQYDHEVKAATVLKPFSPKGAPSDAGVIAMKPHGGGEHNGIVISSGLAPQVSLQDTKMMAMYSIDEAVRNAVVTGADPERMVLIDNFCWPDPLPGPRNPDYAHKLAELVRCNEGLYEMATVLGMPFVSGKDSMKNDAIVKFQGKETKISVLPTLLVTCMGHIDDIKTVVKTSYGDGQDLWILGGTEELNPYTLSTLVEGYKKPWSSVAPEKLIERYRAYHQCIKKNLIRGAHDVSEGGAVVAFLEMAMHSGLGFDLDLKDESQLFGEGMGMIVFAALKSDQARIKAELKDARLIGTVRKDSCVKFAGEEMTVTDALNAYRGGNL
ncbi:MAG TPA: phosphoribosylglycinamide formyltransferase [Bacteriovoracaceae bacterium]|nr:phosphoribosylglycinamide formyltransferase [Bacteriovoracaceae bacterium]